MSVDVSVVVVTYNSRADIATCIDAIYEHTRGVSYEIVVIDNASRDGSTQLVRERYPAVRVVARTTNVGLSAAINEGVAASTGRYIVVMNPDARLRDDVLSALTNGLRDEAGIGVIAPKILNDDGSLQLSCRAFPSHATAIFSRYSLATRLFPNNRYSSGYLMSDFEHDVTRDVDWVSGATMMFPRAVFDRLGGWDVGFFMFNEDVDFCRRVRDAELRVVYEPSVAVYHRIGVSKRAPARIIVERHKSMWRYYSKHMRGNALVDAATAAGITARCAAALAGAGVRNAAERIRRSR